MIVRLFCIQIVFFVCDTISLTKSPDNDPDITPDQVGYQLSTFESFIFSIISFT